MFSYELRPTLRKILAGFLNAWECVLKLQVFSAVLPFLSLILLQLNLHAYIPCRPLTTGLCAHRIPPDGVLRVDRFPIDIIDIQDHELISTIYSSYATYQ